MVEVGQFLPCLHYIKSTLCRWPILVEHNSGILNLVLEPIGATLQTERRGQCLLKLGKPHGEANVTPIASVARRNECAMGSIKTAQKQFVKEMHSLVVRALWNVKVVHIQLHVVVPFEALQDEFCDFIRLTSSQPPINPIGFE